MQLSTAPKMKTVDLSAALILGGCCAIWGVGLVMLKIANTGISPFLNGGLRSVIAGLLLWAIASWRGVTLFSRDGTLGPGLFCGALFALEFLALYPGLALTNVSRGTIFLHAAPFVAAIGEHYFLPNHKLDRNKVLGLLAAFAGLVIALADGLGKSTSHALWGDVLCLLAGVFWGMTTVVIRGSALRTAPAEKTLLYQLAVSGVVMLLASLLVREAGLFAVTPKVTMAFIYTVLFVAIIGYTTWFWLMRTYSAASLHAFTFLSPIFGAIAGGLILGEATSSGLVLGLALVAVGIYLVNRPAP